MNLVKGINGWNLAKAMLFRTPMAGAMQWRLPRGDMQSLMLDIPPILHGGYSRSCWLCSPTLLVDRLLKVGRRHLWNILTLKSSMCCYSLLMAVAQGWNFFLKLPIGGGNWGLLAPHRLPCTANSNIYTKNQAKTLFFFSVFTMCSVEDTVIYAVFGLKSVQNSGFCSVFKALASKKVQCRDLPKPLKTQLFTLFSSIFPCANAAGQLKHIYKKLFKNIVFCSIFTFFPSKTL